MVVVLGLVGALLAWLPGRLTGIAGPPLFLLRLLSMTVFYWMAVHIVAAPFPRYSVPLRPELYALALLPLIAIPRRLARAWLPQRVR